MVEERDQGRIKIYSLSRPPDQERARLPGALLPFRSPRIVHTGLDLLALTDFSLLRGRSFALLTNATGRDRNLKHGLALMLGAKVRPSLLLEPEHGLYSDSEALRRGNVRVYSRSIRVLSLYSRKFKKPRPEHLEGIDLIVVDLQNLPVRCYTYVSTLTHLMEAAQENDIELLILDRPNPYGFWRARGAYLNERYEGFTSLAPVPFLYSLTLGEYALYMADLRFRRLRLGILRVSGYSRDDLDGALRQVWVNPSPNIPSPESALVYAGLVFFEGVNLSLGRGTTRPFVYSGAPWMKAGRVLSRLRRLRLPGVQMGRVRFRPSASIYRRRTCQGLQIVPLSVDFDPLRTGYEYMRIVKKTHPEKFRFLRFENGYKIDYLWGGVGYREAVEQDLSWEEFRATWINDAEDFERKVRRYRLY